MSWPERVPSSPSNCRADIRDACVGLQESLASAAPGVKWVEEENLHITLLFLGEVDDRDLIGVCRAVQKVCDGDRAVLADHRRGRLLRRRAPAAHDLGRHRRGHRRTGRAAPRHRGGAGRRRAATAARRGSSRRTSRWAGPRATRRRRRCPRRCSRERDWKGGECEVSQVRVLSSELRREGPVYAVLSTAKMGERSVYELR